MGVEQDVGDLLTQLAEVGRRGIGEVRELLGIATQKPGQLEDLRLLRRRSLAHRSQPVTLRMAARSSRGTC